MPTSSSSPRRTQRHIVYPNGLDQYLWTHHKVLLKDFKAFAEANTERIRRQIEANACQQGFPEIRYIRRSTISKPVLQYKQTLPF